MKSREINISTERLELKGIKSTDAESMFQYRSKPEIYKFQGWRPETIEEVYVFIRNNNAKMPNTPETWYQVGIFVKETDTLVGDIGIHFVDSNNQQVEIGYTLSPEQQGKGYATEAVIGVINYLFTTLNKHRLTASVDPENKRSIALLERIGMRKEGHFQKSYWANNEWTDDVIYAILEEEWIDCGGK